MKVGELFAVLELDDQLTPGLDRAEGRMRGARLDGKGAVDLDTSGVSEGLDDVVDDVDSAGDDVAGAVSGWSGAVGGAAAALGALAGQQLMGSLTDALEIEAANAKLDAQLNLNPEALAQFGHIGGELYVRGFAESAEEGNEAIRRAVQNGLIVDDMPLDQAEEMSARLLAVSDTFGGNVEMTAQAVGHMLKTGIVDNADEAFDVLTRGLQSNANNADDLLETFQEYSTQFRELGLDAATATGLMSQGLEGGARDADVVADGLKELAIRAQDGSEASAEALNALGIAPDAAAAAFREGGDAAALMTATILQRLRETRGSVDESVVGVGLLGTKWEDMQDAVYNLDPSTAASALGEVEGAATDLTDTLEDTRTRGLHGLKRDFDRTMSEGWSRIMDDPGEAFQAIVTGSHETLVNAASSANDFLLGLWDGALDYVGKVPEFLGGVWDHIEDFLGKIPEALGAIFEGLEGLFVDPLKSAWNMAADWFNGLTFPTVGPYDIDVPDWLGGPRTLGPWGGWDLPDLPTFHTGGDVVAPQAGGEVIARLLDGERVLNRADADQWRSGAGGPGGPSIVINGSVITERNAATVLSPYLRDSGRQRRGRF